MLTKNSSTSRPEGEGRGKVSLVGSGPGDPDLLTIKALKAIESADLILFDQLIGEEIKALFPKATPAFYVGKTKGNHSIAQSDLNKLLLKKAQSGLHIVRLKGGDPFVFGRGGEELQCLVEAGIDVEVVPGITAASGCAASIKIPLTQRAIAQGCTFVTAHAERDLNVDWSALASLGHTLVFYMGITKAQDIESQLLEAGMSADMPVAIVENASRSNQREILGSLGGLVGLVKLHKVKSPALIVVGDVLRLAENLNPELWAKANAQNHVQEFLAASKCA